MERRRIMKGGHHRNRQARGDPPCRKVKHIHPVSPQCMAPSHAVEKECASARSLQVDDDGARPSPLIRNAGAGGDKQRQVRAQEIGQASGQAGGDTAETPVGIEDGGAGIEADVDHRPILGWYHQLGMNRDLSQSGNVGAAPIANLLLKGVP